MKKTQQAILEFHKKHGFPFYISLKPNKGFSRLLMWLLCKITLAVSKVCYRYWKLTGANKECFYRFHLMTEELSELMVGVNKGDEISIGDGLGDLLYVTIGTGVTYCIPVDEVIKEVCHSNSLKAARNKNKNLRLRDKGAKYRPPNIKKAIEKGRMRLFGPKK